MKEVFSPRDMLFILKFLLILALVPSFVGTSLKFLLILALVPSFVGTSLKFLLILALVPSFVGTNLLFLLILALVPSFVGTSLLFLLILALVPSEDQMFTPARRDFLFSVAFGILCLLFFHLDHLIVSYSGWNDPTWLLHLLVDSSYVVIYGSLGWVGLRGWRVWKRGGR